MAREFGGFAEGFAGLEDAEDGDVEVPAVVEIPQAECAAGTEMEIEWVSEVVQLTGGRVCVCVCVRGVLFFGWQREPTGMVNTHAIVNN